MVKICCIGAGYGCGPTMAVIALKCPKIELLNPDCKSASRFKAMVCFTSLTNEEKDKATNIGIKPYSWEEYLNMLAINVLWTRLSETGKDWRYVYKPLGKLPQCFVRDFGDLIDTYIILRDPNPNPSTYGLVNS